MQSVVFMFHCGILWSALLAAVAAVHQASQDQCTGSAPNDMKAGTFPTLAWFSSEEDLSTIEQNLLSMVGVTVWLGVSCRYREEQNGFHCLTNDGKSYTSLRTENAAGVSDKCLTTQPLQYVNCSELHTPLCMYERENFTVNSYYKEPMCHYGWQYQIVTMFRDKIGGAVEFQQIKCYHVSTDNGLSTYDDALNYCQNLLISVTNQKMGGESTAGLVNIRDYELNAINQKIFYSEVHGQQYSLWLGVKCHRDEDLTNCYNSDNSTYWPGITNDSPEDDNSCLMWSHAENRTRFSLCTDSAQPFCQYEAVGPLEIENPVTFDSAEQPSTTTGVPIQSSTTVVIYPQPSTPWPITSTKTSTACGNNPCMNSGTCSIENGGPSCYCGDDPNLLPPYCKRINEREVRYKIIPHKRFQTTSGNRFILSPVSSLVNCCSHCNIEPRCVSVNYNKFEGKCEILLVFYFNETKNLVEDEWWKYGHIYF